jgi:hypothetical protein
MNALPSKMKFHPVMGLMLLALISVATSAQVVNVTMVADTNRIPVGGSTMLRAYAQIIEPLRAGSDRIFSWYVDFQTQGESVAKPDYALLQKPDADKDPLISSFGTTLGADRIAIYDTFMNLEGAGKSTPVLLFSVPVTGVSIGVTEYQIGAGTGVPNMSQDFFVAPLGGGDPLTGGIYTNASVRMEVIAGANPLDPFPIVLSKSPPATKTLLNLSWPIKAGWRYSLESRTNIKSPSSWQPVPSVLLTTGSVTITNTGTAQFFRIKAEPAQ